MDKLLYGVDLSKKITPMIVRDAIIECFMQAHMEVLDLMDEFSEWSSEEERNKFREMEIKSIVKIAFKEAGVDFNNPSKENMNKVLDKLAEFAANFRKPEVIHKHYDEIMSILNKCE